MLLNRARESAPAGVRIESDSRTRAFLPMERGVIAVRIRENVQLGFLVVPPSREIPVVGTLPSETRSDLDSDLLFLAARLKDLTDAGVSEHDFREALRGSARFATYADAAFPPAREALTLHEAEALVERGLADAVLPDLDQLEAIVAEWNAER